MDQEEKEKNQREEKETLLPTTSPNANTPPNNENGKYSSCTR